MTAAEFLRAKKSAVAFSSNALFMMVGAVVGHWVVWAVAFVLCFFLACAMELAASRAAKR